MKTNYKKQSLTALFKKYSILNTNIRDVICKEINISKENFFLQETFTLTISEFKKIERAIKRIGKGEPIEYLLEKAEFYGQEFFVDKRCLIPRDDTEVIVVESLKSIIDNCVYIDIGTGSGAIPISVLKNTTHQIQQCYAIDIEKKALEVALINIKKHKLSGKIELVDGNLFQKIPPLLSNSGIDTIILTANLPYIKANDLNNMDKPVYTFEPSTALYGGKESGFELYEKLIIQLIDFKNTSGVGVIILFIEIGFDQKEITQRFLDKKNLKFQIFKDSEQIERCVKITF